MMTIFKKNIITTILCGVCLYALSVVLTKSFIEGGFFGTDNNISVTNSDMTRLFDGAPNKVRVIVYTVDWCAACKASKEWLTENRINYWEKNIEYSDEAREEFNKLGVSEVPVIVTRKNLIMGYNGDLLKDILLERD
ncbi:glutaredoxin family protein [Permianibacter aggregans]|uniref:Glutaredoxin n=1 Tax=Permianibacter aggregans TaxID=1510150 RepID=A0A4R6U9F0_9GAMM|nr:glutaredoxin family protein [Permianibacter aggregans]QGX39286.1 glutaredoxin family protein [Permianibacter aggregans]TDQ42412.1 glutaredoxin [Permianibacter aggregans]